MSTIIQTHPPQVSLYLNNNCALPSGGILLNGLPGPSTNYRSYVPRDKFATSKSLPLTYNGRKIRFAPLPDPRKSTSTEDEDKSSAQRTLPKLLYTDGDVCISPTSILPDKLPSPTSPNGQPEYPEQRDEGSSTTNGGRRGKKKTFFKNLLSVNASPIQDATLGLNLFRSGSRDSGSSSDAASSAYGNSSGSNSKQKPPSPSSGATSAVANNSISLTGKTRSHSSPYSRPSPPPINPPTVAPPSPKSKPQPLRPSISAPSASVSTESPIKMLNGRIYGARTTQQQQPQPQPGDWAEPEFVEWGYGGMGSNKSGEAFYGGVQARTSAVMEGDDDYEASGMGWVRRRREKREKEAREREERERKQAGIEREVEMKHEQRSRTGSETPPKIVVHSSEPERDTTMIIVPHRHHSRHPSRSNSLGGMSSSSSSSSVPTLSSTTKRPSPLSTMHLYHSGTEGVDLERSDSQASRTSEEDEASSPRRDNDEDEDEDEEEERRDEERVTSLCAGRERISRHRE